MTKIQYRVKKGGVMQTQTRYMPYLNWQPAGKILIWVPQSDFNYNHTIWNCTYFLLISRQVFLSIIIIIAVNTINAIPFKIYLLISRRKMSLIICYLASSFTFLLFSSQLLSSVHFISVQLNAIHSFRLSHLTHSRYESFETNTNVLCIFLSNSIYQPIEISSCLFFFS